MNLDYLNQQGLEGRIVQIQVGHPLGLIRIIFVDQGHGPVSQFFNVHLLDVLGVDPVQLALVKVRRRRRHPLRVVGLDQFILGEDFLFPHW